METLRRKKGIVFRESVYVNGHKENSPVFRRKTDCLDWKRRRMAEISRAKALGLSLEQVKPVKLSDFYPEWLESKQAQGVSSSTVRNYDSKVKNHLLPKLGDCFLQEITLEKAESISRSMQKTHSSKGVTDLLVLLKQIMRDAHRRRIISSNPLLHLKNIPRTSRPDVYWTESEINSFLIAARLSPYYEMFVVALNTGLRRGELAGLCWDRVDWIGGQLIISRTRSREGTQETTKTKLVRYVPMNEIVRLSLKKCYEKAQGSEFVFTDRGTPLDVHHLYRVFRQIQIKARISRTIRFHDLRHTFASQFMMKGGRPYDLQRILGHTSFQMTERYAHLSQDHLRDAIKIVSFGFAGNEGLSQIHPTEKLSELSVSEVRELSS